MRSTYNFKLILWEFVSNQQMNWFLKKKQISTRQSEFYNLCGNGYDKLIWGHKPLFLVVEEKKSPLVICGVEKETNMIIKTAAVEYSRKFNLGNYESCEISASLWANIEEGEDESGVMEYLFQNCKAQVQANIPPSYKRSNTNVSTTFYKNGTEVSSQKALPPAF